MFCWGKKIVRPMLWTALGGVLVRGVSISIRVMVFAFRIFPLTGRNVNVSTQRDSSRMEFVYSLRLNREQSATCNGNGFLASLWPSRNAGNAMASSTLVLELERGCSAAGMLIIPVCRKSRAKLKAFANLLEVQRVFLCRPVLSPFSLILLRALDVPLATFSPLLLAASIRRGREPKKAIVA